MNAKTLIFATNNQNKIAEIRYLLHNEFNILTLSEAGIDMDIPEPHDSLEANASEKSKTIYKLTKKDCFSEDTGLEVECLNGEPGVKSARYAGADRDFNANIELLLKKMKGQKNRNAQFRTVISLILDQQEYQFEGICKGKIVETPLGNEGFGYDPVFVAEGAILTFGQMTIDEKSQFSHRKKAFNQLIGFLTR